MSSQVDDLIAWLSAQFDDDLEAAALIEGVGLDNLLPGAIIDETGATNFFTESAYRFLDRALNPKMIRAHIDAKRRILDALEPEAAGNSLDARFHADLIRLLALPYADREGYRDEWRP